MKMEILTILLVAILALCAVMSWLLWEIHAKLHKTLELNWQSFLAFEKRLDVILKRLERSS